MNSLQLQLPAQVLYKIKPTRLVNIPTCSTKWINGLQRKEKRNVENMKGEREMFKERSELRIGMIKIHCAHV